MKKLILAIAVVAISVASTFAQDSKGEFSVGADLYNRYVWRGTDFGNSPVVQPSIAYSTGGFSIGAWGSYSLNANVKGTEADLYAGYTFDLIGLSFIITDYYFPSEPGTKGNYFDYEDAHTFELGATKTFGDFYFNANVYLNQANDVYFEAGYSFDNFSLFAGAGDNNYTVYTDFNVVNVGISTSKEIKITESFSLPISGSAILNPESEQLFLVVGVSF